MFRAVLFLAVLGACAITASAEQKKPRIKTAGSANDTTPARPATSDPTAARPAANDATASLPAADTACPADDRFAQVGLRAFIDPQTGQLREPTPEETQALARAAREEFAREVESLEAVVHPDGTISVDLRGLFMQDLVAVKKPNGSLSVRCVPAPERTAALAAPAPAPAALEEK